MGSEVGFRKNLKEGEDAFIWGSFYTKNMDILCTTRSGNRESGYGEDCPFHHHPSTFVCVGT